MEHRIARRNLLAAIALAIVVAPAPLHAQAKPGGSPKVDMGSFIKEIMILKVEGERTQIAMWFPYEFFVAAGLEETPRDELERNLAFLRPYHAVVVQCSRDRADNTTEYYETEKEIRARAVLRTPDGGEVKPLADVPANVSATVQVMKKAMTADGDASSANMHIIIFPATTKGGAPIVDATRRDKLTLVLKPDARFPEMVAAWRTPFDAMTPPAPCAKCHEPVSIKWAHCAWCGAKLDGK